MHRLLDPVEVRSLVHVPQNLRTAGFYAERGVVAPALMHELEQFGRHRVHAYAVRECPTDADLPSQNLSAHSLCVVGPKREVIVLEVDFPHAEVLHEILDLVDHLLRRSKANPSSPECRASAEGAVEGATSRRRYGRHREALDQSAVRRVPIRPRVHLRPIRQGQRIEIGDELPRSEVSLISRADSFGQRSLLAAFGVRNQLCHRLFAFTDDHEVRTRLGNGLLRQRAGVRPANHHPLAPGLECRGEIDSLSKEVAQTRDTDQVCVLTRGRQSFSVEPSVQSVDDRAVDAVGSQISRDVTDPQWRGDQVGVVVRAYESDEHTGCQVARSEWRIPDRWSMVSVGR